MGAETSGIGPFSQPEPAETVSFIAAARTPEPLANARHQLVPHFAVGIEPLLAVAFGGGRIGCRPVLNPLPQGYA